MIADCNCGKFSFGAGPGLSLVDDLYLHFTCDNFQYYKIFGVVNIHVINLVSVMFHPLTIIQEGSRGRICLNVILTIAHNIGKNGEQCIKCYVI